MSLHTQLSEVGMIEVIVGLVLVFAAGVIVGRVR
jgi:hypothetical protein